MSISQYKTIPSFTATAEQVEMRAHLDLLISTFDEKMKGQLLNIFNETVNQIAPSKCGEMLTLSELDIVIMRYPDKYSSVICNLIEKLLFLKRDRINQDEKILNILLDHGNRPEADFGKWLSFFPSAVAYMDFNQYFERDFSGYFEQASTEPTLALSSSEHEESIPNYTDDRDAKIALQVELRDDTRENHPFIDQLFETLTTHPLKVNLIKNISRIKPKKKPSKKTGKNKELNLNSKVDPSGKIAICHSAEQLFNSLHAMIGIKAKKEKNRETPSFHYLNFQEGIEFLKAWVDKSRGSLHEHPHLILISIHILNQAILINKNNPAINDTFDEIKRALSTNAQFDPNLKNNFIRHFRSLLTVSPSSSPQLQVDPVIKQLLLRADLRRQEDIRKIHLTESSIHTIKSTIKDLVQTNTIESFGKALIIYNLHSTWLNEDKDYDSRTEILGGLFTLIFSLKNSQTHIDNLIKQCGEHKKVIFDELNELLKDAKTTTDISEKNNICFVSALFINSGLDSKNISNEKFNLILKWMEAVNLDNIEINESNYKDFLNNNTMRFGFAKNNMTLFQGNTKVKFILDFLQNCNNLRIKIEAFQRIHPELFDNLNSTLE